MNDAVGEEALGLQDGNLCSWLTDRHIGEVSEFWQYGTFWWCSSQVRFICVLSAPAPCEEETGGSQTVSVLLGPPGLELVGMGLGCLVYPTSYSHVLPCLVQGPSPWLPPSLSLAAD